MDNNLSVDAAGQPCPLVLNVVSFRPLVGTFKGIRSEWKSLLLGTVRSNSGVTFSFQYIPRA